MSTPNERKLPVSKLFLALIVVVLLLGFVAFVYVPWLVGDLESKPHGMRTPYNGFDLSASILDPLSIIQGGPPKGGIPDLTNPRTISSEEADYLGAHEPIIGVSIGDEARAYPLKILVHHEIVNDIVGEEPIAVTYCPLCDSSAVFDRRDGERVREFGVSGLLYNSNVLMYDRGSATESLWSQMMTQGVSGQGANRSVKTIPLEVTTWGDWRSRHPNTTVLSIETGHKRNYSANPYASDFSDSASLRFPVAKQSAKLPLKARVLGVWTDKAARAYPLTAFGKTDERIEDLIDGRKITLQFNSKAKSLRVANADEGINWVYCFWFAWYAFHPDTDVHVSSD